jgi:hypothetical protein
MSYYFATWHTEITAALADAEPEAQRLFGPSFDAKMRQHAARRQSSPLNKATYAPWKKPRIERVKC